MQRLWLRISGRRFQPIFKLLLSGLLSAEVLADLFSGDFWFLLSFDIAEDLGFTHNKLT